MSLYPLESCCSIPGAKAPRPFALTHHTAALRSAKSPISPRPLHARRRAQEAGGAGGGPLSGARHHRAAAAPRRAAPEGRGRRPQGLRALPPRCACATRSPADADPLPRGLFLPPHLTHACVCARARLTAAHTHCHARCSHNHPLPSLQMPGGHLDARACPHFHPFFVAVLATGNLTRVITRRAYGRCTAGSRAKQGWGPAGQQGRWRRRRRQGHVVCVITRLGFRRRTPPLQS